MQPLVPVEGVDAVVVNDRGDAIQRGLSAVLVTRGFVVQDDDEERHYERDKQQDRCRDGSDSGVHWCSPFAPEVSMAPCGRRISDGSSIRSPATSTTGHQD